jgi:hypothetical protein
MGLGLVGFAPSLDLLGAQSGNLPLGVGSQSIHLRAKGSDQSLSRGSSSTRRARRPVAADRDSPLRGRGLTASLLVSLVQMKNAKSCLWLFRCPIAGRFFERVMHFGSCKLFGSLCCRRQPAVQKGPVRNQNCGQLKQEVCQPSQFPDTFIHRTFAMSAPRASKPLITFQRNFTSSRHSSSSPSDVAPSSEAGSDAYYRYYRYELE